MHQNKINDWDLLLNGEENASVRLFLILLVVEETSNLLVSSDHHSTTTASGWRASLESSSGSGASGRNRTGRGGRGRTDRDCERAEERAGIKQLLRALSLLRLGDGRCSLERRLRITTAEVILEWVVIVVAVLRLRVRNGGHNSQGNEQTDHFFLLCGFKWRG